MTKVRADASENCRFLDSLCLRLQTPLARNDHIHDSASRQYVYSIAGARKYALRRERRYSASGAIL